MHPIRLAAVALNQTPLAWEANRRNILAGIEAARELGCSVVCLPELCITGYGCEDAFFATGVQQTSLEILLELVPHTRGLIAVFGLPLEFDGRLYNAMALAADGRLAGFVCKQILAGDGIHYEPRWFHPWPVGEVRETRVGDELYPAGDLLFDCGGVKIGMEICRDAWKKNRPGIRLAPRGADIILNPSASHFAFAKQEIRRGIVLEGSKTFHVSYVYSNLLGNEAGRALYDGGTLIASRGEMLAVGPRFSFRDVQIATADVDVEATRQLRKQAHPERELVEGPLVECEFTWPKLTTTAPPTTPSPWDDSPPPKKEEFARAVALGLFDYLRKSHTQGFVVSLSGGADSATVATMVWLMLELGVHELGFDGFLEKLSYIEKLQDVGDKKQVMQKLLSCVYQATRQSSDVTRKAARQVAESIGAEFLQWNIDAMVDGYVDTLSRAIGRSLEWETDDIALQNIQARGRSPSAWLLANLQGSLLLSTSNRSETAVGYATMDGDTSGGLAPIAGIDKAYLLEWLRWMETTGPVEVGPLPALAAVNEQQPSAELRPADAEQTDEGDLMPYRVLDAIERAAIRDKLMPLEVLSTVEAQFSQYERRQLGLWVERFFTLWCRNQWKRERYAPSFHLDDENLDPRSWCRFPILSGGFERELAELREALAREQ